MINIKKNQGNIVVSTARGRISDWFVSGEIAIIVLLGVPNRSYIDGAPNNSLGADFYLPKGTSLFVFGGSVDLDKIQFFKPNDNSAQVVFADNDGIKLADSDGKTLEG